MLCYYHRIRNDMDSEVVTSQRTYYMIVIGELGCTTR